MEDVRLVMDFNALIIKSGITGQSIPSEKLSEAKMAADRLKSQGVFPFDFTDDSSFLRSVAEFAKSF